MTNPMEIPISKKDMGKPIVAEDINSQLTKLKEDAIRRLSTAYDEKEIDNILLGIGNDGLEDLKNVRSSTNPIQRRKYLNAWVKKWRGIEQGKNESEWEEKISTYEEGTDEDLMIQK